MDSIFIDDPTSGDGSPLSLSVLTLLDSLSNSTEEQCFSARSRSTVLQGLPFGGVPTVLALNFILWLLLLLVFSCLRKAAWDYGRLALLVDNDSRFPPSTWNSYE
uniref:Transmembrane protein 63C n=1 Tax=Sphaerodactylus townsendi TaxID=933632 RepID=A0ACB8G589_9SAUR